MKDGNFIYSKNKVKGNWNGQFHSRHIGSEHICIWMLTKLCFRTMKGEFSTNNYLLASQVE